MPELRTNNGRPLTPDEIAERVRSCREALNWKQAALAGAAHVDERTVQRLEAGEKVGAATLKNIGRALNLDDDYFVRHHTVITPEEIQREAEELRRKFATVETTRASTGARLWKF